MEVSEILNKLNVIERKVDDLNKIEIEVSNGKTRHVTYQRNEFFQMLFDRKDSWKTSLLDKVRNYTVILGAVAATVYFIQSLL